MFGYSNLLEVKLEKIDAERFSDVGFARTVSQEIENERSARLAKENPMEVPTPTLRGLLSTELSKKKPSECTPWFEILEDIGFQTRLATQLCNGDLIAFSDKVATVLMPPNWKVFMWQKFYIQEAKQKIELSIALSLKEKIEQNEKSIQEIDAEIRRKRASLAAIAKHNKPGGAKQKHAQIQAAWASGKYTSRDICAEQECAGLGISFAAARRALRNTPEPTRT